MDRRAFMSFSMLAPLSAVAEALGGHRPYRQPTDKRQSAGPVATGLPELDNLLHGGLPAAGVTLLIGWYANCAEALLLNMTDHHLRQDERPIAYVSGEHTRNRVLDLLACIRTGLDRFGRRRGRWGERERNAFECALDHIRRSKLHFEDARCLRSLKDTGASLHRLHDTHGLGLVVFDNATWFAECAVPGRTEAGAEAVGRELSRLAASMAVPVVAYCPLPWIGAKEEVEAPTQADLAWFIPMLKHCAACLSVHYDVFGDRPKWEKSLSVRVEFHPANSRNDCSVHLFDSRNLRIEEFD